LRGRNEAVRFHDTDISNYIAEIIQSACSPISAALTQELHCRPGIHDGYAPDYSLAAPFTRVAQALNVSSNLNRPQLRPLLQQWIRMERKCFL
jgi:hypothetical protein